jgi:hypothetical protein
MHVFGKLVHHASVVLVCEMSDLLIEDSYRLHVPNELESVEADLSDRREQTGLADTTHAWLLSLRQRLAEVEENTEEAFRERRQLVKLLVASISAGKRQEDGRTEIHVTYRFGPPSSSGAPEEGSFVEAFKNAACRR